MNTAVAVSQTSGRLSYDDVLRRYGFERRRPFLDQLDGIAKLDLFHASYEIACLDFPTTATAFAEVLNAGNEPATQCGKALLDFVRQHSDDLATADSEVFATAFVRECVAALAGTTDPTHLRFVLLIDEMHESDTFVHALRLARCLWQLRSENPLRHATLPAAARKLDATSLWAYWNRKLSHPLHIQDRVSNRPVARGYAYDLRKMIGFDIPRLGELRITTRDLLHEAATLRTATVPDCAYVEINFPPFVALCFAELAPNFVIVEALTTDGKGLPVYLFPSSQQWQVAATGFGPDGRMTSFDQVAQVIALMTAAALRDFWIVEDRESTLTPPRIKRISGMANKTRRVVYLPRLRYRGSRGLRSKLDETANTTARAAHWRSDHYRKLPAGTKPTAKQMALAAAHRKTLPDGHTWVRGSSVAGEEVERVYRSRSVAHALFDILPSKGKAIAGLSWFAFEAFCGDWLRNNGFDEVC